MAENNKNISPDAENEPVNGADENTAALSDASEIKAQENENVSVEKTAEPTDDDVLSEIKEALDKAEKSDDEDNIFPDKSRSSSDSRFEPITEDDFKGWLSEAQEWAASVGYTEEDVNDIIKSVRAENHK